MPTIAVQYPHLEIEGRETPVIAGTRIKVIHLAVAQNVDGSSAEDLHEQYPHLTMGQIHSALAYYWDHKEELDAEIERRERWVEELRAELRDDDHHRRLREKIHAYRASQAAGEG